MSRAPRLLRVALALAAADDGVDVCGPRGSVTLAVSPGSAADEVSSGPRVGVSGAGGDADAFPWRFWSSGDPTVSAYRRAP